ncbi:MAG: phospho-N-acetylmuramoyl-pentapeptide-transferase [Puniceicoccales bacterium]|jgi:phospho-N-acetylmuramoyl-pentapeptide-transferase|nr:phospho-N-acetylmuramoyl-pentapeptide-transferase [Puniceicoccales bacterium]
MFLFDGLYAQMFSELFSDLTALAHVLKRMILAFSVSFLGAAIITPPLIRYLKKLKLEQVFRDSKEVRDLAAFHSPKAHTPTMGGIIIVAATLLGTAVAVHWNTQVVIALCSYLLCAAIGVIDDLAKIRAKSVKGMPGRIKLLIQLIASAAIIMALRSFPDLLKQYAAVPIPFTDQYLTILPLIWLIIFLFFVLAGTSNSVNLTDGLDGLATGCAMPVLLFLIVVSLATGHARTAILISSTSIPGNGELAVICAAVLGALVAFLWHNTYPAAIFMGDTGSLSLGALIGIIAFLTNHPLHLVIAGGIFVIEALSDILQVFSYKFFNKRRIFKMAPLHHHFELSGYHETKITVRFVIVSGFLSWIGCIGLHAFWS